MSRSLLFRSLAKNLGESPDLVLKRINKIHVSVSYKGAGQTGLRYIFVLEMSGLCLYRKLVQEYSAGIRLSNPSMAFTAKIIAEKDFVPTVDLETGLIMLLNWVY